jgi:phage tail sheath protein FI
MGSRRWRSTTHRPIIQVVKSSSSACRHRADAEVATFPSTPRCWLAGAQRKAPSSRGGTLKDACDAIFDQVGATVVVVRVADGTTEANG